MKNPRWNYLNRMLPLLKKNRFDLSAGCFSTSGSPEASPVSFILLFISAVVEHAD
jgi:hypothetical protein